MGKVLTASTTKLGWIFRLTNLVPPSKIKNALKFSSFRRALKLALKDHNEAVEGIISIYKEDLEDFQKKAQEQKAIAENEKTPKKHKEEAEKKLEELVKNGKAVEAEANGKIEEYVKANDKDLSVTFDNEAYQYTLDLFGETASDIFGQYMKDKDGNVKQEAYDGNGADELFDILESAK